MHSGGHQKKILIVDDQPENIHILIENLESEYEILFATTGEKALEIVFTKSRPDLILLDILMPGMSGYEVCAKLKANDESCDIPVAFVTSQGQETDETAGFRLGAVDYIVKPFRIPVVQARIRSILRLEEEMYNRKILANRLEDLNRNLEDRIKEKTGELLQAHENLKVSEKKFRTIFENAIEGIFQSTPDGKMIHVSPSLARILGYPSPQDFTAAIPNAARMYARPEDRKVYRRILEKEGQISGFETQFKKQNGELIWVMLSAKVIYDEEGNIAHFQGFVIDITERKRANELERANIQLRELDKLKSALMSTASHDLRSPMTAILGFNELIRIDFAQYIQPHFKGNIELEGKAQRIMDRLEIIEREGRRLIRLVNDFLDLSRFESGCTEWNDKPVQLTEIVEQAANVIKGQLPPGRALDFSFSASPDLPAIICDPDRIMQVIINLLGNAAKFTREGRVAVRILDAPKDQIEVRVTDTGPGIPEEEREKIFNKFYQIRSQENTVQDGSHGSGLGLAICKQIVEHYGGTIWVESEPGAGSTFIFRLPRLPLGKMPVSDHLPLSLKNSTAQKTSPLQNHLLQ